MITENWLLELTYRGCKVGEKKPKKKSKSLLGTVKTKDFDKKVELESKGYTLSEIITAKDNSQTWVLKK